jgi:hypothetical protein
MVGSSTTKTGRHDIAEILLKVAVSTKKKKKKIHLQLFQAHSENCITLQNLDILRTVVSSFIVFNGLS